MMTSFQGLAVVLELQILLDELGGIDLDPDRRGLLAAYANEGDAGNLADALGENVFRCIVHVDDRRDRRLDREDQDRRV